MFPGVADLSMSFSATASQIGRLSIEDTHIPQPLLWWGNFTENIYACVERKVFKGGQKYNIVSVLQ